MILDLLHVYYLPLSSGLLVVFAVLTGIVLWRDWSPRRIVQAPGLRSSRRPVPESRLRLIVGYRREL